MSQAADDHTLMCDLAGGDQRALSSLVSRHSATVRAVARRFTGNDADADEVAQDVFFKVWTNAGHFDPAKAQFTTWLYRITANHCFDLLRRRKRWAWVGLDAAPETPDTAPRADTLLDDRETLAAVRRDILDLPERQRMALLLVVTAGRSAQDVAEVLGIGRPAAEQLIVRARQTLRQRQRERTES